MVPWALQVSEVVERVEDAEDVDAVNGAALDEFLDEVVGVMPVAEDILAAEQHLLRRVRHRRFQAADALPGVLTEVANAGVERRTAPGLDGPEAELVEFAGDGQHVVDPHPRCQKALVRVAQHKFGDAEGFLVAHRLLLCISQDRRCRRIAAAIAATSSYVT
jgi:hypothetical protein